MADHPTELELSLLKEIASSEQQCKAFDDSWKSQPDERTILTLGCLEKGLVSENPGNAFNASTLISLTRKGWIAIGIDPPKTLLSRMRSFFNENVASRI
ncbi:MULTISPECIES: hypothetical protein [unclassified Rhizobium]|uniref:hypothetical protein n=1 Tax=unclassified Rhizobium TaxID=2613769 RepID=UPI00177C4F30|nr:MULTISPECIES: hypothetical protein [unclassified Rhizobium]MBD8687377.1 hypothetical protein [Rhizobium sp. CFBP 13644]MBD8691831.1 hypothetical protein [Rhizobium sp. CFBP 13717]